MNAVCERTLEKFESYLDTLLPPSKSSFSEEVYQAARYSLLGDGKRIRPKLFFSLFNESGEEFMPIAAAIEMIHTYSLIHDDLPCIDDDSMRRGKPSLHIAFSESTALLAGDLLLSCPYSLIANCESLLDSQKTRIFKTIGQAISGEGLIGGQMLDIASEGKEIDLQQLEKIAIGKTGEMLALPLVLAAICLNLSEDIEKKLYDIGLQIGVIFQITDDIIDCTSTLQEMGKTPGSDLAREKSTFVKQLGLDGAKKLASEKHKLLDQMISSLPFDTSRLHFISKSIVPRRA